MRAVLKIKHIYLFFLLAVQILSVPTLFAQKISIDKAKADSIQSRNWDLGNELHMILLYNQGVKAVGYTDTISIEMIDGRFHYFYGDSLLTDFRYAMAYKKGLIKIDYAHNSQITSLLSITRQTPSKSFEMEISNSRFDKNELIVKLTNFKDGAETGRYIEQTMSGKILLTGQYCQIDTNFIDTIFYTDPGTYDTIMEVVQRNKYAVKTGVWKYYSPLGALIKEEEFRVCEQE